jgi:hypothetical protein
MSSRAAVVTAVVLVAVGVVIGGLAGGLAALGAVGIGQWRGYRAVAGAALVALVAAALLAAFEAPATAQPTDYLFDFALDRPLAAEVGRIAGIFVIVAVALAAVGERERSSPPSTPGPSSTGQPGDGGTQG